MIYGLKRGDFYSGCGGLSMDASHRLVYLNTCFLDGRTDTGWRGIRGVVLLREVYQSRSLFQFFFLYLYAMQFYSALKKNENFRKMIELDSIIPSEKEQGQKVKYNEFPFICRS